MTRGLAPELAAASCLALMRAGEQSAAQAFARIVHRLTPGEFAHAGQAVTQMIADEERHDVLLAECATALPAVTADLGARHFFRRLETREPGVHLARISALDACSCQLLSRMLGPVPRTSLSARLITTLSSIRRDEGAHVRSTRRLALDFGVEVGGFREIAHGVRHSFAALLRTRAAYFEALGVDSDGMIRCIERD
ncbi:MAG TPA: hypothetical protein VGD54_12355, partial [Steroidobacteraceae bacterium]